MLGETMLELMGLQILIVVSMQGFYLPVAMPVILFYVEETSPPCWAIKAAISMKGLNNLSGNWFPEGEDIWSVNL